MFSLRKFLVVLLSLGAFVAFAACSGSDGSDGKNGANGDSVASRAATTAECGNAGGTVYYIPDANGDPIEGSEQIVCNNDSNYGAVSNNSCLTCHTTQVNEMVSALPISSRILGTSTKDQADRDAVAGGVHFISQHSSYAYPYDPVMTGDKAVDTSSCNGCHYKNSVDNRKMNAWLGNIVGGAAYNTIGVASCIECHGLEDGHYATRQTSTGNDNVTSTFGQCDFCHVAKGTNNGANNRHDPQHGDKYFSQNAGDAYALGGHGTGSAHGSDANGNVTGLCGTCHTYMGAKTFNPMNGVFGSTFTRGIDITTVPAMAATPVACANCHNAHTGDLVSKVVKDTNKKVIFSSEFVLCTSCHSAKIAYKLNAQGEYSYFLDNATYGAEATTDNDAIFSRIDNASYHYARPKGTNATSGKLYRNGLFAVSHFGSDGKTMALEFDATTGGVTVFEKTTGFDINAASEFACTACHDPHKTSKFAALTGDDKTASGKNVTAVQLEKIVETFVESPHGEYSANGWDHNANSGSYYYSGYNYSPSKECAPCHNGIAAAKFMSNGAANAWANGYLKGMQMNPEPTPTGCGTCHDLDNTTQNSTTSILTGKLRTITLTNNSFVYPAQGYNGRTDNMTQPVLTVQTSNKSLVCMTCHSGQTNAQMKALLFSSTKQQTFAANGSTTAKDNNSGSIHHAPGGAVAAGVALMNVKATKEGAGTAIVPWIDATDATQVNGMKHAGSQGQFGCFTCHDVNNGSHTFAVFTDINGKPVFTKGKSAAIATITGTTGSADGCGVCHSTAGSAAAAAKVSAKGYSDAVVFLDKALGIKNASDNMASKGGAGTRGRTIWNEGAGAWSAQTADNATVVEAYFRNAARYATYVNFDVFYEDFGAYAHAGPDSKKIMGQSLRYLCEGALGAANCDSATKFIDWVKDASLVDAEGTAVTALTDDGLTWVCGSTTTCTDFTNW